jgi:hypothetical protein
MRTYIGHDLLPKSGDPYRDGWKPRLCDFYEERNCVKKKEDCHNSLECADDDGSISIAGCCSEQLTAAEEQEQQELDAALQEAFLLQQEASDEPDVMLQWERQTSDFGLTKEIEEEGNHYFENVPRSRLSPIHAQGAARAGLGHRQPRRVATCVPQGIYIKVCVYIYRYIYIDRYIR